MKRILSMLLACLSLTLWAQEDPFKDFRGIKAKGIIPNDFSTVWADKYYENPVKLDTAGKGLDEMSLETFWVHQNHALSVILGSGKFSFGDPLSEYINEVANKLFAHDPKLRSELRFYLYRDPSANAFCVADGLIGVHNGLMANLNTEAELAFVLAHEAAHYIKEHLFESYFEDHEQGRSYDLLESIEDRLDRSKEQELEADRIGLELFLKAGYKPVHVRRALVALYESYHPVGRCTITKNPFALNASYDLPEWAFKDFKDSILDDYNYLSIGHEHPNIAERMDHIDSLIPDDKMQIGLNFLVDSSRFFQAKKWAQFENIRLNILAFNLTEALYEINCLEDQYPNNRFLQFSKMRALYGLSAFRVRERFYQLVPVPSLLPGPVKNISHSLFQFTKAEMVGVALRYLQDLSKLYPDEVELKAMRHNLHRMLYSHSNFQNPEELFSAQSEVSQRAKEFLTAILPSYFTEKSTYLSDYHADESYRDSVSDYIPEPLEKFTVKYEDYREFLDNQLSDGEARGLYILDPVVFVENKGADVKDKLNSLDCEETLIYDLPEIIEDEGLEAEILDLNIMDSTEIDRYNRLSDLHFYYKEARVYHSVKFPSARLTIKSQLGLDYHYVSFIAGLIRPFKDDEYYFDLVNLKTGKTLMREYSDEGNALLPKDFLDATEDNLKDLKK